jgi:hypothetical protein
MNDSILAWEKGLIEGNDGPIQSDNNYAKNMEWPVPEQPYK